MFFLMFILQYKASSQNLIQAVRESSIFEKNKAEDCKPKGTYNERKKGFKPKKVKKKSARRKKKSWKAEIASPQSLAAVISQRKLKLIVS